MPVQAGHHLLRFAVVALLLSATADARVVVAQDHAAAEPEEAFDPVHHVSDDTKLDFAPFLEIPLPRILIVRTAEGAIVPKFYRSTEHALASGDFILVPEADELDEPEMLDHEGMDAGHAAEDASDEPAADALARAGDHAEQDAAHEAGANHGGVLTAAHGGKLLLDLSITRHLLFAWIVMLLVYLLASGAAKKYKQGTGRESAPRGKSQNLLETLVLFVRDDIARPNIGVNAYRFLPYLLSVFFFILGCNLIGLLPYSATPTSNITVTAILAILTFIITQISGTKDYWKHLAGPPGVPWYVRPLLVPVEILGLFTKPFALAVRLFANMTAGHIVILSLIGLIFTFTNAYGRAVGAGSSIIWVAFTLFILCLELLVAFLQAYIFTMLSALFIGMAVEEHEHGHEHEEVHA